jgi:hypothetical protein
MVRCLPLVLWCYVYVRAPAIGTASHAPASARCGGCVSVQNYVCGHTAVSVINIDDFNSDFDGDVYDVFEKRLPA